MWFIDTCRAIVGIVLVTLFILCFCGCSTPKTITVTEYRDRVQIDTVTVEREHVDSTYQAHYLYHQGDTVHQVDTIYKYRLKYVDKVQTQYVHVRDSIPYQVEVVKEVRRRNGYDRFTSWGFWLLALLILIRAAWWAFKTFYLRR